MSDTFQEFVSPIAVDLRQPNNQMDIIKGLEDVQSHVKDELMSTAAKTAGITAGDWLVKSAAGTGLTLPTTTAQANTYPIWVGNDQYDSQATGQATLIVGCGFIYRTTKFVAGSYTEGQNLTVKDDGTGTVRVPSAASGSDPILARVYTAPDANGVMEIEVLVR